MSQQVTSPSSYCESQEFTTLAHYLQSPLNYSSLSSSAASKCMWNNLVEFHCENRKVKPGQRDLISQNVLIEWF